MWVSDERRAKLGEMLKRLAPAGCQRDVQIEALLAAIIEALPDQPSTPTIARPADKIRPNDNGDCTLERSPFSNPQDTVNPKVASDQNKCESVWMDTLEYFKAPRPSKQLSYNERKCIAESIKQNGTNLTIAALYGRRFEARTESFDPGKHLAISRTFDPERMDVFINLSAAHKAKASKV